MTTVTIHEAKTHLSRLIKEALAGGEVTIRQGRSGEELVKLIPVQSALPRKRVPGRFAHLLPPGSKGVLDHGFWDPLPDEDLGLGNEESDL